jgi:hypothetical protein
MPWCASRVEAERPPAPAPTTRTGRIRSVTVHLTTMRTQGNRRKPMHRVTHLASWDVPNPNGEEVLQFAIGAKLAGTSDDENAKAWTAPSGCDQYHAIEGNWSSRWGRSGPPHDPGRCREQMETEPSRGESRGRPSLSAIRLGSTEPLGFPASCSLAISNRFRWSCSTGSDSRSRSRRSLSISCSRFEARGLIATVNLPRDVQDGSPGTADFNGLHLLQSCLNRVMGGQSDSVTGMSEVT